MWNEGIAAHASDASICRRRGSPGAGVRKRKMRTQEQVLQCVGLEA